MFRTDTLPAAAPIMTSGATAPSRLATRLVAAIAAWRAQRTTQRVIDGLDDHLRRDIGLGPQSHDEALRRRLLMP